MPRNGCSRVTIYQSYITCLYCRKAQVFTPPRLQESLKNIVTLRNRLEYSCKIIFAVNYDKYIQKRSMVYNMNVTCLILLKLNIITIYFIYIIVKNLCSLNDTN